MLMPATPGFTISGFGAVTPKRINPKTTPSPTGEVRHGKRGGRPDVRMLGGHFAFESPDAPLLVSLLPVLLHVRGVQSLSALVRLVREECMTQRPGREHVLASLAQAGLLRGLADTKLAMAMRIMHGDPARSWKVEELAKTAALSRSAFFERFTRAVGLPPMEYLLAWRMALAKKLLRSKNVAIAAVAEQVGYRSASTFSTAFSRYVGQPPGRYARMH